jgi:hypothetical protein
MPCHGAGLPAFRGTRRSARSESSGSGCCLTARGDALLELAAAVLSSDRLVGSRVQLSLEPEFRRGHGALYHALAAGRVDGARLFSLLTEVLPLLVGGPEARAWTAGHDVIDRRMLDRTPAPEGPPVIDKIRRHFGFESMPFGRDRAVQLR